MPTRIPMIVAAAAAMAAGGLAHAQASVVRLGTVAPLSGGAAHAGQANLNGVRMAVEELNARGIAIGGQKVRFELLAEDDAGDPKQGVAAAQKLVDARVHGVIGHQNSGTAIPASRLYSDAGIPQISPSVTHPRYTRQGFATTFRMVADDVQLGGMLGRYAVKELHLRSFAVVDDRTAYGQGLAREFAEAVRAAGGAVVDQQFTTDKATDFSAILTAIKAKKPDVLFIGGMYATAGPMLRQMQQLGLYARLMGGDGICNDAIVPLAAGAVGENRIVCAEPGGFDQAQQPGLERFHAAYRKRFGSEAEGISVYAYDAVNLMAEAMVQAGSAEPKRYLPVLASMQGFQGVSGGIAFDGKGDRKDPLLTLYTFRNARRATLAVVRADASRTH